MTVPAIKTSYTVADVLDIAHGRIASPGDALARELLRALHTEPLLSAATGLLTDFNDLPVETRQALERVAVNFIMLTNPKEVRR